MKTSTPSAILRSTALILLASALVTGCKKDADADPNESAAPAEAPIEVGAVPVVQDGVFRYDNEIVTSGKATLLAETQVRKGADEASEAVTSLDKDLEIEKRARRGDWMLVSWKATEGQPSFGWAPSKALSDKPEIQPVAAPAQDAGADAAAADAGKAVTDAGAADADAKLTDAGSTAAPDAAATAADAGSAKVEPAAEDAGAAEVAEADAGKEAPPADDGGTGLVKLPLNKRLPILKLPVKREKAQ